jgi:hypothetical protein
MPKKATYNPGVFHVASLDDARRIILTPEGGLTTPRKRREPGSGSSGRRPCAFAAFAPYGFKRFVEKAE